MTSHMSKFQQGTSRLFKAGMMFGITALVVLLAACGGGSTPAQNSGPHILTIGVSPAGDWTRNFNPLLSNGNGGNLFGTDGLLYEPLMFFNQLQPGSTSPLLATSYQLSTDGKQLTIHLQSDVKWSDGKAFSSADVVFTFNYMIQHDSEGVDQTGLKSFVKDVSAPDANTVVVDFNAPSSSNVWYLVGQTYIIPQHVWQGISTPAKYSNDNPVGTGPFVLKSFAPQVYKLGKNSNFRNAGSVKVDEVDYPAFESNTSGTTLLAQGSIDWTGLFVADIQHVYIDRDPSHNVFYSPGVQTTMLLMNMKNPLFQDLNVRKAISAALNRAQYSQVAESGYQTVANPTGLVLPIFQSYLNPSITATYTGPQASQSAQLLQGDGYSKDGNGYFAKNGKELAFSLMAPNGWSDWNQMETMIQTDLKAAGIKVNVQEPAQSDWFTKVANGNFETTLRWTNHGPSPFYMYNALLSSSFSAPIGSGAVSNMQRWEDKNTDSLLSQYANSTDPNVQKQAIYGLEQIMVNQVPVIPLLDGSDWNEYTTARFTGWATAQNPYALPAPFDAPDVEQTVLHLTPVS